MQNNVKVPQKVTSRITMIQKSHYFWVYSEKNLKQYLEKILYVMFIVASFTIAKS